jgi:hypothetical protein
MVRYYCDKCGKEVPKEKIRHCSLYVKEHKTGLGEIKLTYCKECFEEIIGADNVELIRKTEAEREARKKAREQE